ncbi:MAG: ABC transporter ATP-binding protein [Spirochaetota bacterium]
MQEENEEDIELSVKTLWRLIALLKPYRWQIALSLLLMVVGALAMLAGPYLTKQLIDDYVPNKKIPQVFMIGGIYALLVVLNGICVRYRLRLMVGTGNKVIENLRGAAFEHALKLSFSFYDQMPSSKIMVRIVYNTDQLQQVLKHGFVNLLIDIFRIILILCILLLINFKLSLIVLGASPLIGLLIALLRSTIHDRWQAVQQKNSVVNAFLQENISGIKVNQSYLREDSNRERMEQHLHSSVSLWMRATLANNVVFPLVLLLNGISILIAYLYGFEQLRLGLITIGGLVTFVQYTWMFNEPIVAMSQYYSQIMQAISAAERVFDILDRPIDIRNPEPAIRLPDCRGEIRFEHVDFSYKPDVRVLKDLNFTLKSGERIAIVGETGAGKTTIINLLTRFYDIQGGRILLDGHDIRSLDLSDLRRKVGVMMQDSFLFNGSIRENIRYGNLGATDEEVYSAAKLVHAHEFIVKQPQAYDTVIGERGVNLSLGQRQLLAFARILLYNPQVLILDEATSSIDTKTELLLQQAVEVVLSERTSVVIAHRLSTVRNADRIFVMAHGRIIEEGPHHELLAHGGKYFQLYESLKIDSLA